MIDPRSSKDGQEKMARHLGGGLWVGSVLLGLFWWEIFVKVFVRCFGDRVD